MPQVQIRIEKGAYEKLKARAEGNHRTVGGEILSLLDLAERPATPVTPPAPAKLAPERPEIIDMAEIFDADALSYLQEQGAIELDLEKIFGDGLWEDEKLNSLKIHARGKELGAMIFGKWEKLGEIKTNGGV